MSAKSSKQKESEVGEVGEEYEIIAEDPVTCHRASNYLALGFDIEDAFALARTRDSKGVYLYHRDIKKMLDQGATHDQVVSIHT